MGLQIYTLRGMFEADPGATFAQLRAIGYENIELFGQMNGAFFGRSVAEIKRLLDAEGLISSSGHVGTGALLQDNTGTLTNDWERGLEQRAQLNQRYAVLAWLQEQERQSIDDYKRIAALLNTCGEISKEYGIAMAYHNHDFEFQAIDGQLPYDVLLAETDPDLVQFELDIYWIHKAGYRAVDYFAKAPGRYPLWHVKDMGAGPEKDFEEVGQGVIDWQQVFGKKSEAGLVHFFVEQDNAETRRPIESVTTSYTYLQDRVL